MLREKIRFCFSLLVVLSLALMGVSVAVSSPDELPEEEIAAPETPQEQQEELSPEEKSKWDMDGIIWGLTVDWAALYPEKEEEECGEEGFLSQLAAGIETFKAETAPYTEVVEDAKAAAETAASEGLPNYREIVELANAYDAWLGWEIVDPLSYNPVVETEEGYFVTSAPRADQSARAEGIAAHAALAAAHGAPYLYIQLPGKVCREDEASGTVDFFNQNADRLLEALALEGIETLDLRAALHEDGLGHHEAFYKTDHHWLPQTGLWAAGRIAQRLNETCGFDADETLFDEENFTQEVYEDHFLGSQGKKVTLSRARPEDFSLWYPNYETAIRIEIPSLGVDKAGDFAVFYRYGALLQKDYYVDNAYGAFLYGDQALVRVTNETLPEGRRILLLGDSYDNCLVPFLSAAARQLHVLDLRFFDGSVETFLDENEYDVILEMVSK